jgi:hypothetical protein
MANPTIKTGFKPNSEEITYHYGNKPGVFVNAPIAVPTQMKNKKTNLNRIFNPANKARLNLYTGTEEENTYWAKDPTRFEKARRRNRGYLAGETRQRFETPEEYAARIASDVERNIRNRPVPRLINSEHPLPAPPPPPPPPPSPLPSPQSPTGFNKNSNTNSLTPLLKEDFASLSVSPPLSSPPLDPTKKRTTCERICNALGRCFCLRKRKVGGTRRRKQKRSNRGKTKRH